MKNILTVKADELNKIVAIHLMDLVEGKDFGDLGMNNEDACDVENCIHCFDTDFPICNNIVNPPNYLERKNTLQVIKKIQKEDGLNIKVEINFSEGEFNTTCFITSKEKELFRFTENKNSVEWVIIQAILQYRLEKL